MCLAGEWIFWEQFSTIIDMFAFQDNRERKKLWNSNPIDINRLLVIFWFSTPHYTAAADWLLMRCLTLQSTLMAFLVLLLNTMQFILYWCCLNMQSIGNVHIPYNPWKVVIPEKFSKKNISRTLILILTFLCHRMPSDINH